MGIRPVRFWYLRHGETDWNRRNLAQGRSDVPLNGTGLAQAARAAAALADRGIARIVCSPLVRARATADIVARALSLPVDSLDDLRECDYGDHEGTAMQGWFQDWVDDRYVPPNGESFAALRGRAAGAIDRCLASGQTGDGTVLVVAHGALMRALRAEFGLPTDVRTPNATPLRCDPPVPPATCWTLFAPDMPPVLATPAGA